MKHFIYYCLLFFIAPASAEKIAHDFGFSRKNILSCNLVTVPSVQYERNINGRWGFSLGIGSAYYYRKSLFANADVRFHLLDDALTDTENDVDIYLGWFVKCADMKEFYVIDGLSASEMRKYGTGLLFGAQSMTLNGFVIGGCIGVGYSFLNYEYGNFIPSQKTDNPFISRAALYLGYAF